MKKEPIKRRREKELEQIRRGNGGVLRPSDVVAFAKNKKTALHSYFEWDDSKAAAAHRLEQARELIRVVVTVLPNTQEKVNVYASLPNDRKSKDGGYRAVVDILDDEDLTAQLLDSAARDLDAFRTKYARLRKVASMRDLFTAIDRTVRPKVKTKKAA
jgi:hypothetical protein